MADAKRSSRFCAVPGCEHTLSKHNRAAVCVVHTHAPGLCRCPRCAGTVLRRLEPQDRPGVRSVSVARFSAVNSGETATLRVSLPCEPWLRGDA
jgi:hypothetical protein